MWRIKGKPRSNPDNDPGTSSNKCDHTVSWQVSRAGGNIKYSPIPRRCCRKGAAGGFQRVSVRFLQTKYHLRLFFKNIKKIFECTNDETYVSVFLHPDKHGSDLLATSYWPVEWWRNEVFCLSSAKRMEEIR